MTTIREYLEKCDIFKSNSISVMGTAGSGKSVVLFNIMEMLIEQQKKIVFIQADEHQWLSFLRPDSNVLVMRVPEITTDNIDTIEKVLERESPDAVFIESFISRDRTLYHRMRGKWIRVSASQFIYSPFDGGYYGTDIYQMMGNDTVITVEKTDAQSGSYLKLIKSKTLLNLPAKEEIDIQSEAKKYILLQSQQLWD